MIDDKPEKRILGLSPCLLAILFLGTVLRFLNLGGQSVWVDEGFSRIAAHMSWRGVTRLSLYDVHPPLYYYLLKVSLWVLPDTEFGLRFVSVLSSIWALAIMMNFVYQRWGHRAACYVGLLVALSPFDIYYAQEARMYAFLAFWYVLAFTELVASLEGKPAHLIGWVIGITGLAWTHAYGFLTAFLQLGFLASYWIWQRYRGRPFPLQPKPVLAALVGVLLGIAPIVLFFFKLRHTQAASVEVPVVSDLLVLVRWWATGPTDAFPAFRVPWWMPGVSAAAMVGCAVLGARQLWRRDECHQWILYFAAMLIVLLPALVFAYSTLSKHPLWLNRGFLPNAHILYLLAGIGLSTVGSRALRGIVAVVIGASIVTGEIYYYTRFEKSPAAAAFHSLPEITPQHIVVLSPLWLDYEAYYYLRAETTFWAVEENPPWRLVRLQLGTNETPRVFWPLCDEVNLQAVSDIYAYGDPSLIRTNRTHWPACLQSKKIWVFEHSRWYSLDE